MSVANFYRIWVVVWADKNAQGPHEKAAVIRGVNGTAEDYVHEAVLVHVEFVEKLRILKKCNGNLIRFLKIILKRLLRS